MKGVKMKTGRIVAGTVGGLHYTLGYCDHGHKIIATRSEVTSLFSIADKQMLKELQHRKSLRMKLGKIIGGSL